jgi:three-Cys-motif partner protein
MADSLPTIWPADPHTLAKHKILFRYVQAWMAILGRQMAQVGGSGARILYVDGFAGPGIYVGGEKGSPILALEAALNHSHSFRVPVRFVFIEQDKERHATLRNEIEKVRSRIEASPRIDLRPPVLGDCATELNRLLDEYQNRGDTFGPALVFLDQFGYSEVPLSLVRRLLVIPRCEVFSYLNWDHLNRFLTDESKWPGITEAFGSEDWKKAIDLIGRQRRDFLLNAYLSSLKQAGARFVAHFEMFGENDTLLYWLFFCTSHIRGLEEMKKAMWKVDDTGLFRFSDAANPNQQLLLGQHDTRWLATHLVRTLAGKTLGVPEIMEYVLVRTPCVLFKDALKELEAASKIEVSGASARRRRGTFSDAETGLRIRFS